MIADLILTILFWPARLIDDYWIVIDWPEWLIGPADGGEVDSMRDAFIWAGEQMAGVGYWVDMQALSNVLLLTITLGGALLVYRLIRFIVSLFTGGGGAT